MSKRLMLLASAFSVFMAVGNVAHAQAPATTAATTMNASPSPVSISLEQQKSAQAELDRFSKMTRKEQNQYMKTAQQQADQQLQAIASKLTPEQKTVLESQRVRAKLETVRFTKMNTKQRKAYLQNMQDQLNSMSVNAPSASVAEPKAAE